MSKSFAPRIAKKNRSDHDLSDKLPRDLLKWGDDSLLKGATLDEIRLKLIHVKDQVRTKFNDKSIKELADNIRVNGLIQPLVVHKENNKYVLICGERRYRAMMSINFETAPCFILSDKTEEELMAIQFSENSSREELHYIDKADGILNYQQATKASERKIQEALGISKSEVHRSLLIAKLPGNLKVAAKNFDIEKYVLLELDAIDNQGLRDRIEERVVQGEITKRSELKRALNEESKDSSKTNKKNMRAMATPVSATAFIKAMKNKSQEMGLDKETEKVLQRLVTETRDALE